MEKNNDVSKKRNYSHMHMHDHDHDQVLNHIETPVMLAKDKALIEYVLKHSKQHAHELAEMCERLTGAGLAQVSAQIQSAIECFDKGNDILEKAAWLIGASSEEQE